MIDFAAMPSSIVHTVTLMRHPDSRSGVVRSVGARVCGEPGGTLAITYLVEGDLARLRVPPQSGKLREALFSPQRICSPASFTTLTQRA